MESDAEFSSSSVISEPQYDELNSRTHELRLGGIALFRRASRVANGRVSFCDDGMATTSPASKQPSQYFVITVDGNNSRWQQEELFSCPDPVRSSSGVAPQLRYYLLPLYNPDTASKDVILVWYVTQSHDRAAAESAGLRRRTYASELPALKTRLHWLSTVVEVDWRFVFSSVQSFPFIAWALRNVYG